VVAEAILDRVDVRRGEAYGTLRWKAGENTDVRALVAPAGRAMDSSRRAGGVDPVYLMRNVPSVPPVFSLQLAQYLYQSDMPDSRNLRERGFFIPSGAIGRTNALKTREIAPKQREKEE
jgi:hypothetical protein